LSECQRCGSKSQLFLCPNHTDELRDMLSELPRLTRHLAEAATGQTRLGEPARRSRSDEQPMRINLRASDLLDQVNGLLVRWVQGLCESHGITYQAVEIAASPYDGDAARLAFWLSRNVNAITAGEDAGMCFNEIHAAVHRILSVINRPIPPRFCGPCPSPHPDDQSKRCNNQLTARGGAIDVKCQQCENTHNVEDLWQRMLTEVGPMRFTVEEILTMMSKFGEPLSDRTFRHWRKHGKVKPFGYRRSEGKTEPMYRLSDVIGLKYKVGAGS
jgi:hypothetical protein